MEGGRKCAGRIAVFAAAAAVLLALWGCGGGDSGTGAASSPAPSPPGAGTGVPGIDGIREELLDAVNQARASARMCGAQPYAGTLAVAWNDNLAMAAYLHSLDMADNGFFSHTGSDGSSPGDRITREGYDWWIYGENIAVGYPTVAAVMEGWLGSEGHCRNIMDPDLREIGAAFEEGAFGGDPSARYWTLDLATSAS